MHGTPYEKNLLSVVHTQGFYSPLGCTLCVLRTEYTTRSERPKYHHKMAGFIYVEILIATVLIAVALVPAMEALTPAINGSGIHQNRLADHYNLVGKLEDVLAQPFNDLESAAATAGSQTVTTSYSDTVTYPDGRQITRNVYLSLYDSDNADSDNNPFTGTDAGLMWARVEIAGTGNALETLTSE